MNAAIVFRCEAPEVFCGPRNFAQLSMGTVAGR